MWIEVPGGHGGGVVHPVSVCEALFEKLPSLVVKSEVALTVRR
jgi:hypothetical protein